MRKNPALGLLSISLLAASLLLGCATPATYDTDPRIILDASARANLRVVSVDYATTVGKTPCLNLVVQSQTSRPHGFEYKIDWLDADGQVVDTVLSSWKRMGLTSSEVRDLRLIAPRVDITSFRLQIRRAD